MLFCDFVKFYVENAKLLSDPRESTEDITWTSGKVTAEQAPSCGRRFRFGPMAHGTAARFRACWTRLNPSPGTVLRTTMMSQTILGSLLGLFQSDSWGKSFTCSVPPYRIAKWKIQARSSLPSKSPVSPGSFVSATIVTCA